MSLPGEVSGPRGHTAWCFPCTARLCHRGCPDALPGVALLPWPYYDQGERIQRALAAARQQREGLLETWINRYEEQIGNSVPICNRPIKPDEHRYGRLGWYGEKNKCITAPGGRSLCRGRLAFVPMQKSTVPLSNRAIRHSGVARFWTFACALALMGCTLHARKEVQHIESELKYATSENATCQAWLKTSDVYQRLNKNFIVDGDDSEAADKILIDRYPYDGEKVDLLRLNNLAAVCRKNNLENFGRIHPNFVSLLAQWYAQDDALLGELLRDRLTIGHANKIVYMRLSARRSESQTMGATITQDLETSHQSGMTDRQQAVTALQQWNHEQQLISQQAKRISPGDTTRLTTCTYHEDRISCTLY